MRKKFILIVFVLLLILITIFLIIVVGTTRPIKNIESKFNQNRSDFEYVADILANNNKEFKYIHIHSEFMSGLYVTYEYPLNDYEKRITTEDFDNFFENILPSDKTRIYEFIRKNGIQQIVYSENNIEFVMWSLGSRARGIWYFNDIFDLEVDLESTYLDNIYKNYYVYEVR